MKKEKDIKNKQNLFEMSPSGKALHFTFKVIRYI